MARTLVIQLARLGDLVQSMPAIAALRKQCPQDTIDLLCPQPLRDLGTMIPGVDTVIGWDGARWHRWADQMNRGVRTDELDMLEEELRGVSPERYDRAFVLNQHPRALLAGALLADQIIGPLLDGPLSERLSPWAAYVREIARTRRSNRVHLSDAFCGMCHLMPPGRNPRCLVPPVRLPRDMEDIGRSGGPWIGLIVGAGDPKRQVPVGVWRSWIAQFLSEIPRGRVVLLGQGTERELAQAIQETLPPSVLGRMWDLTGRTMLRELAQILSRCTYVIGSDTGPFHLAAAIGTPVIGWYFARARVHETGPYGPQHVVWQATPDDRGVAEPQEWPIDPTLDHLLNRSARLQHGWTQWFSHEDSWGTYYSEAGHSPSAPKEREAVWRNLDHVVAA